jgi:hypothetical protein
LEARVDDLNEFMRKDEKKVDPDLYKIFGTNLQGTSLTVRDSLSDAVFALKWLTVLDISKCDLAEIPC